MVAEPPAMLLTTPNEPTVATAVLLLDQVPPGVASLSDEVPPAHTLVIPVIGEGLLLTVTMVLTPPHEPASV
jgi:hypothetical protein